MAKKSFKSQRVKAEKINQDLLRRKRSLAVEIGPQHQSPFRLRADAWENIITGLGTADRDKRVGARLVVTRSVNEFQTYEDLYHGDDLARTVVEIPAQEMVRQWITVLNDDEEDGDTMGKDFGDNQLSQIGEPGGGGDVSASKVKKDLADDDEEDSPEVDAASGEKIDDNADEKKLIGKKTLQKLESLEAQTKIYEAEVWAQVFGGSLLFLGIDDGIGTNPDALAKPLNEENIKAFKFLSVFDRWDVDVYEWYADPKDEKFGLPKTYRIRQNTTPAGSSASLSGSIIHETRVIRFSGAMVNRRRRLRNAGWDDSIYIRLADTIRDFAMAWGGVAHLLQDFAQGVFSIKGLADALLADQDDLVLKRMKLLDMSRSIARAVPIDADSEKFERTNTPVSGMDALLDRFALRLAAAARMPVTLLMGQSPAGLNATGDSDIRNFYDYIKARQEKQLRPKINRILQLLFKSKDGPTQGVEPKNWSFKFNPLWQATDKEQAEIRLSVAQSDQIYFNMGALTPEEIAQSRFGGDSYSVETVLDTEQRAKDKVLNQKLEKASMNPDGSPKPIGNDGEPNPDFQAEREAQMNPPTPTKEDK